MRKIVHLDMDCFYAAVETRDDPALRGRPVAVAWRGPRGVVLTANYEARRYGVRSAMATTVARRRCPELVLAPPRMAVYREVSSAVQKILRRTTDLVEPLSLDEAYLDVTAPKQGRPRVPGSPNSSGPPSAAKPASPPRRGCRPTSFWPSSPRG